MWVNTISNGNRRLVAIVVIVYHVLYIYIGNAFIILPRRLHHLRHNYATNGNCHHYDSRFLVTTTSSRSKTILHENNRNNNDKQSTVLDNKWNTFFMTTTKPVTNNNNKKLSEDDNNSNEDDTDSNELLEAVTGAAKQVSSDFFGFLRVNAAQALTKSLPEEQRQAILQRVAPTTTSTSSSTISSSSEDDYDKSIPDTKTIDEKVVEYELMRKNKDPIDLLNTTEKEEIIMKRAEEAAMARLRNEIAMQEEFLRNVKKDGDDTHHPILGKCIINLGYKRIYLASAEKLSSIPVWQKQRIYRHNRAKKKWRMIN